MLVEAAVQRSDTEMLTKFAKRWFFAMENTYHKSNNCYLKYIKLQKLDVKQREGSKKQAVKTAVGKLISEFQAHIIDENQTCLILLALTTFLLARL